MSIWRRFLSILLPISIVVGGIVSLVIWSRHTDRFPLRTVEVKSELMHISEGEIQELVRPHLVNGFFGLDVEAVQKSLKCIPWIESAEVRRIWPDQLVVLVKEQRSQAKWGEKGILSTDGTIFYPQARNNTEKLPEFFGPLERSKEMQQQYLALLELLAPIGLTIKTLNLSPSGGWQIVLDNGIEIILGKAGLNERTARFVQAYKDNLRDQIPRIAYIDLRYTNGFSIGWKKTGVQ